MVACETYIGSRTQQPLNVVVDNIATLVIDFHSHLATSEIIGFLAGTWNSETKTIHVKQAYPAKAIDKGDEGMYIQQ